jgi:hypothetical protein
MTLTEASIATTLIGIPAGGLLALTQDGLGVLGMLILGPLAATLVGAALAVAALVRRETPRWLSIVALVLALAPAVTLATLVSAKRIDEERYQNSRASAAISIAPVGGHGDGLVPGVAADFVAAALAKMAPLSKRDRRS